MVMQRAAADLEQDLLSDDEVSDFIVHGVLKIETGLPESFHGEVRNQLDHLTLDAPDINNRVCNNLLAYVPELDQLVQAPGVKRALRGLLGEGYMLLGHKALQPNLPKKRFVAGHKWHRDEYYEWYRPNCIPMKVRDHLPWSIHLLYAPIDIDNLDIGPTRYLDGSHYWNLEARDRVMTTKGFSITALQQKYGLSGLPLKALRYASHLQHSIPSFLKPREDERFHHKLPMLMKRGQAILMHSDLWHIAKHNSTSTNRSLVKLVFARTEKPSRATWAFRRPKWQEPQPSIPNSESQKDIHQSIWAAMSGWKAPIDAPSPSLASAKALILSSTASEPARLEAAYSLALSGRDQDLIALFDLLDQMPSVPAIASGPGMLGPDRDKSIPAYALSSARPCNPRVAIQRLLTAMASSNPTVRGFAARIGGNWGLTKEEQPNVPESIARLLSDGHAWVRGQATVALGRLCAGDRAVADLIADKLADPEEFVRQYAAESLVPFADLGPKAVSLLAGALKDDLRDVRNFALEALVRSQSPKAREIALHHLRVSFFCELSYRGRPY